MPVIALKPLKARLIVDAAKDTILVLRVALADGEAVALAAGGRLDALPGVMRIRERDDDRRERRRGAGTLTYVPGGDDESHAKYQIDVALPPRKFDALVRLALAGRLPAKLFVDAGSARAPPDGADLGYWPGSGGRVKRWDNVAHRVLPVARFSLILPVVLAAEDASAAATAAAPEAGTSATADHPVLVDIADELLSSMAETRTTTTAVLAIIAVVVVLILVADLMLVFR
jgi:hypothetical protein